VKWFAAGIFVFWFLAPGFTVPGQADEPAGMGLGELSHLLAQHPARTLKPSTDISSLDVFQRSFPVYKDGSTAVFSIPGFKAFGCDKCHQGEELLTRAEERMRLVLARLVTRLPQVGKVPFKQYIIQSWTDELLRPPQLAHVTYDTIRIFPGAILIDEHVYGRATHLHESLHLTQRFVGHANELEAYGLNIRSDPRFLFLNYPYFSSVVTAFFMPEFPEILKQFFAREVKENYHVPREVQWFYSEFDREVTQNLRQVIAKMEPLLAEVSRVNREFPLEASYLTAQTGTRSLLLDIAAASMLEVPPGKGSDTNYEAAFLILDNQIRKTDNTRLGYKIDRKEESLMTMKYQLHINDPVERLGYYYQYLKKRFVGPDGKVRLVIEDEGDYRAYLKGQIKLIKKMAGFAGLTEVEAVAAKKLVEKLTVEPSTQ
jgi:hypothetical protein